MKRAIGCSTGALLIWAAVLVGGSGQAEAAQQGWRGGGFELIGHEALMNRGANAGFDLHGGYMYVGSHVDGGRTNAGVVVVDVSDPAAPSVAGQIPGNPGEITPRVHIWHEQDVLIVQGTVGPCSVLQCSPVALTRYDEYRFYDISGGLATEPELIATHVMERGPSNFQLWADPRDPARAVIYALHELDGSYVYVLDISYVRKSGLVQEVAAWNPLPDQGGKRILDIQISSDGRRALLAYGTAGLMLADTAQVAQGHAQPALRILTEIPTWGPRNIGSARWVPGTSVIAVTEQGPSCPWGWAHFVGTGKKKLHTEYRTPANTLDNCSTSLGGPEWITPSNHSAHELSVTRNLAFVTWHAEGLQVVDISDPLHPVQAAAFLPDEEPVSTAEDPFATGVKDKVQMWGAPILRSGLVYVMDYRNGLYILRYTGPFADEVIRAS